MPRQVVAEFDAITGPFNRKMDQIDRSVVRFERNAVTGLRRVETGINSLVSTSARLSTLTGVFAGAFGLREAARFVDAAKRIRNALREAGDASDEAFGKVSASAIRSLADFEATSQGVLRFTKALNGEQEFDRTLRQLETLNKLLKLSGKTAQEQSSTMIQFSQALQAGFLGGEELRAVRENAPIDLVRAIAREAGGTIGDLKDLAANYELTTEVMIRALESLETEADRRFRNVSVTMSDAATVFRTGAIGAIEQFDQGLGASEAIIRNLSALGQLLAENEEAALRFGQALGVAAAVGAGVFAGNRAGALQRTLQSNAEIRRRELADAKALVVTNRALVDTERKRLDAANRAQRLANENNRSPRAIRRANRNQVAAVERLAAAQVATTAATTAASAAQARMALSTRALASAGRLLQSTWAFIGGWPGLILTAATAFVLLRKRTEETSEAIGRLTEDGGVPELAQTLRDLSEEYRALASQLGTAEGVREIPLLRALEEEFERTRRRAEEEVARIQANLDELQARQSDAEKSANRAGRSLRLEQLQPGFLQDAGLIAEFQRQLDAARSDYEKYTAAIEEETADLVAAQDTAAASIENVSVSGRAALQSLGEAFQKALPAAEKQSLELERLERDAATAREEFAEFPAVLDFVDRAMAAVTASMSETSSEASVLTAQAQRLQSALSALGSVRLSTQGRLDSARAQLEAIRNGATQEEVVPAGNRAARFRDLLRGGADPRGAAETVQEMYELEVQANEAEAAVDRAVEAAFRSSPGGGGGGGGTAPSVQSMAELRQEAESFIRSQQTSQEQYNSALKEAVRIRDALRSSLGEEAEIVAQMTEAIDRYSDSATTSLETMNDTIVQMAANGASLEDILIRIVTQLNSVEFLKTIIGGGSFGDAVNALFSANGNVIRNGRAVQLFGSGGITNGPIAFGMRNGIGIAGEAGAEAIVPLPDGRSIPVDLQMPDVTPRLEVHVHENAVDGPPQVLPSGDGTRIDVLLPRLINAHLESGAADMAMRRYGVGHVPLGG